MKNNEDVIGVALTKEVCPLCAKEMDGDLLINTKLTPSHAKQVKEYHGKVIGFAKEPCPECKDMMTKGFLLIGVVEAKSGDLKPENIYRSGNLWVITHEAAARMFKNLDLSKGAAFLPVEIAHQIGFTDANLDA